MRELKFRAWDGGELLEDVTPVATADNNAFPYPAIVVFEANGETDGIRQVDFIEQYTGLKDKNGKEIYEGDIVKMPLELGLRQVGFVSFINGRFLIKDYEWEDGSYHIIDFFDYNIPKRDFEIIGNIHENPELLEGEK